MDNREKIKEELLEELKKEYQLIPINQAPFTITDILDRYYKDICKKCKIQDTYANKNSLYGAIRKCVALHFGMDKMHRMQLRFKDKDLAKEIRLETERFIKEYILGDD